MSRLAGAAIVLSVVVVTSSCAVAAGHPRHADPLLAVRATLAARAESAHPATSVLAGAPATLAAPGHADRQAGDLADRDRGGPAPRLLRVEELLRHGPPDAQPAPDDEEAPQAVDDLLSVIILRQGNDPEVPALPDHPAGSARPARSEMTSLVVRRLRAEIGGGELKLAEEGAREAQAAGRDP